MRSARASLLRLPLDLALHRVRRGARLLHLPLRAAHRPRLPLVHQRGQRGRSSRATRRPPELARRVAITSLVFVLGFSTVFVRPGGRGDLRRLLPAAVQARAGRWSAASIIIVLGLHTAGIIQIKWLLYEKRAEVKTRPLGLLGAYVVGLAFAFGWTPCIGPILGAILLYASQQETVTQGVVLLSRLLRWASGSRSSSPGSPSTASSRRRAAPAPHAGGGGLAGRAAGRAWACCS